MSESWVLQASPKIGDMLINIRAESPDEFWALIENVSANAGRLGGLSSHLNGVATAATGLGGQVVEHQAERPVAAPVQVAVGAPPVTAPAAPQGGRTATDRYQNRYTEGAPGAPLTPYGPMVLKEGISRAGKPYKAWIDPRLKAIPWVWESGVHQDPPDPVETQFVRG